MDEDYIARLQNLLNCSDTLSDEDKNVIIDSVKCNEERASNSSGVSAKLYEEASNNAKVKIVEAAVPSGILPSEYAGFLYDVRVSCNGPDDKIYRKNKWIRENITRGMTFLEVKDKKNHKRKLFDLVIYANKKFLGGIGDEDESQPDSNDAWLEFCLQNPNSASQIICMTKVNGEAGHFAGRFIDGEFYLITGSKNVHMIIKNEDDIEKYKDSRYAIASIVARTVMRTLQSLLEEKLDILKVLLDKTKLTSVCELTQPNYQHIVNLSHLSEPQLILLMFTSVAGKECMSFTGIPPLYGLIVGRELGFDCAEFEVIPVENASVKTNEIRGGKGIEGSVFYYITKDSKTVGLTKVKSAWYIMLRALREKASHAFGSKNARNLDLNDKIKATKKRFKEIQNWLNFGNSYLHNWEVIAEKFMRWLHSEIRKEHRPIQRSSIRPDFPKIWARFLEETNTSDDFSLK